MYGSPRRMVMGIRKPSAVVIEGVALVIRLDFSFTMQPKCSSWMADRMVLESKVMSAVWCTTTIIGPCADIVTPAAVTMLRFRTVWSSIPLRSMVRSVTSSTRMSDPAIQPLAPLSMRAAHFVFESDRFRRLTFQRFGPSTS